MTRRRLTRTRIGAVSGATALAGTLLLSTTVQAAVTVDTEPLRDAVTVEAVMDHLEAFQAIAYANGGNRQAGTSGHDASVDYVEELLDAAGYVTTRQEFTYERVDFTGSSLAMTAPSTQTYTLGIDYYPMDFSGGGTASAPVTA